MDRVEGSGNNNMMEWSDDEDLGGEGSGARVEGSGDTEGAQDQAIVPFITSEDVRQTEPTVFATTTTTSTIFTGKFVLIDTFLKSESGINRIF